LFSKWEDQEHQETRSLRLVQAERWKVKVCSVAWDRRRSTGAAPCLGSRAGAKQWVRGLPGRQAARVPRAGSPCTTAGLRASKRAPAQQSLLLHALYEQSIEDFMATAAQAGLCSRGTRGPRAAGAATHEAQPGTPQVSGRAALSIHPGPGSTARQGRRSLQRRAPLLRPRVHTESHAHARRAAAAGEVTASSAAEGPGTGMTMATAQ